MSLDLNPGQSWSRGWNRTVLELDLVIKKLIKKQGKKGTSYVDCANLAVYKEMKIAKIFSFDKFYSQITKTAG